MMRKGGSKQKGNYFERKICVALSQWVTNGKKSDCFWRSAMSGGRATVGHKRGEMLSRQAGDICSVSPEGHSLTDRFYIELKHYKNLQLGQFLLGNGILMKFWLETCKQAERHDRSPMLIAKQNHAPILVITDQELMMREAEIARIFYRYTQLCYVYRLDEMLNTPWKEFSS